MAGAKEIRTQIKSIQKHPERLPRPWKWWRRVKCGVRVTGWNRHARLRKRFVPSFPHMAQAHAEYQHPYLNEREEIKRVGYIVVFF